MYFYADRQDRAGNRLITSYNKQAQATKYGGANAKQFSGERFLNIREDGSATLSKEGDLLVRTLMIRPEGGGDQNAGGKFRVYGRTDGKWERTSFSYKNYAAANSAVKSALISLYEACAVIEDDGEDEAPVTSAESGDDAPFDL